MPVTAPRLTRCCARSTPNSPTPVSPQVGVHPARLEAVLTAAPAAFDLRRPHTPGRCFVEGWKARVNHLVPPTTQRTDEEMGHNGRACAASAASAPHLRGRHMTRRIRIAAIFLTTANALLVLVAVLLPVVRNRRENLRPEARTAGAG